MNNQEKLFINDKQKLLIEMVMRQTAYTFDEAKTQLDIHNNNYINVIKNALGIIKIEETNKDTKKNASINQQIYKEIRGFMDTGSKNYISTQNKYKKQQEIQSRIKPQQELLSQKKTMKQKDKLECLEENDNSEISE